MYKTLNVYIRTCNFYFLFGILANFILEYHMGSHSLKLFRNYESSKSGYPNVKFISYRCETHSKRLHGFQFTVFKI